ncbi:unnamed protein product [Brassica oleracea]
MVHFFSVMVCGRYWKNKASKLHLKPRRFKLFLEALEHQLLKDRRKSTRKRACHGERGLDNLPLKMILCDSQNVKKLGPGRASTKHGESLGYQLENGCVDPPATEGSHCLIRDVSFDSDSFDAAIPAHILRHQNKPPSALLQVPSGSSSIWDDEDTRDAFSFQKNRLAGSSKLANVAYPGGGLIINDLKYRGFICCGDSLGKENYRGLDMDFYIKVRHNKRKT